MIPIHKNFRDFHKFKRVYLEAFPKEELLPIWVLRSRAKSSYVNFFAFYDGDRFVGFTYLISKNDLTFVLYLAVDSNFRGLGYGSAALKSIGAFKPNNRIFLTIEALDSKAENYAQRVSRKKFYLRNNYYETGIFSSIGGFSSELLSYKNSVVTFDNYLSVVKRFATPLFAPLMELIIKKD